MVVRRGRSRGVRERFVRRFIVDGMVCYLYRLVGSVAWQAAVANGTIIYYIIQSTMQSWHDRKAIYRQVCL